MRRSRCEKARASPPFLRRRSGHGCYHSEFAHRQRQSEVWALGPPAWSGDMLCRALASVPRTLPPSFPGCPCSSVGVNVSSVQTPCHVCCRSESVHGQRRGELWALGSPAWSANTPSRTLASHPRSTGCSQDSAGCSLDFAGFRILPGYTCPQDSADLGSWLQALRGTLQGACRILGSEYCGPSS